MDAMNPLPGLLLACAALLASCAVPLFDDDDDLFADDDDTPDDDDTTPPDGPVAVIVAFPGTGYQPLTVSLDGAGSTAPGVIEEHSWDLDGDGVADAWGEEIENVFAAPGSFEVTLTVTDDEARTSLATETITVLPDEPVVLFDEPFDSDPFGTGRWTVYLGDCAEPRPGTVEYPTGSDGCGGVGGYITRGGAPRCVVYGGAPFSTEGYRELVLDVAWRTDGGAVSVDLVTDAAWQQVGSVSGGDASWQSASLELDGVHTGLRANLQDGGAVDCLSLTGVPMSRPVSARACPGGVATLSVSAVPGVGLSYVWHRDGVPLSDGDGTSGAEAAMLVITDAGAEDEGTYRCAIGDASGAFWSNESTLVVATGPAVVADPVSVEVTAGQTATFSVEAQGVGEVLYRWQRDGVDLDEGTGVTGIESPTLTLTGVDAADDAAYRCVVIDECGTESVSEEAHLYVRTWDGEVALVPGQAVQPGLDYASNWIIEADLFGCDATGSFARYLREEDRLDLFNRNQGNLALRFANTRIWFESANVGGVSTPIGSADHFGETLAGNVLLGDHAMRIEYIGVESVGRMYWDGALIGDWNLWIESVPGPMGDVDVDHIASGSLRWYQGDFVSWADF